MIVINIICSVIASLIFLFIILFFLKPSINICPFICKGKVEFDNDTIYHSFKIVNQSWFSAFDIKLELYELRKYPIPPNGAMNTRYTSIALILNTISKIPPYRPVCMRKEVIQAIRIRTSIDIEELLKDPNVSVQLEVSLRHGLTGLTKVFKVDYCDISEVKKGKFTYGTKFDYIKCK
ncbi:hypothetical protein [Flavobacterium cerinum]|uniref:Uncharacterized protein n=1 Tax=Flavobacterium cerinum TaxID=2502784 RepID=A0ABY5IN62_9FLAO|nr:hypothetical protein [Flavobacterium cerinum]UUC44281.1 hypothetical protein NOX80_11620 [Flavobacterium cerinum]